MVGKQPILKQFQTIRSPIYILQAGNLSAFAFPLRYTGRSERLYNSEVCIYLVRVDRYPGIYMWCSGGGIQLLKNVYKCSRSKHHRILITYKLFNFIYVKVYFSLEKCGWNKWDISQSNLKILCTIGVLIDNIQYAYLNRHLLCSGPNMFTELSHYELTYSVVAPLTSGKINS